MALLSSNQKIPSYDTGVSLTPNTAISGANLANAQRLGIGSNITLGPTGQVAPAISPALQQSFAAAALKTKPPVSPLTQKPIVMGSGLSTGAVVAPDAGGYKGVAITPGTDQEIADQIARIDAGQPTNLASGAIVSADAAGNIQSPYSFNIDTSGPVSSDVLNSNLSRSDVSNTRKSYADYVNGLATAQQYSPEYAQAYNELKNVQAQEAQLRGNLATGAVPGDTQDFANGFTDRALMGASAKEAFANIALQTQELIRQGNIAGAKALVDAYAPQSVSPGSALVNPVTGQEQYSGLGGYQAVQGIQTVNNLAQTYPDANILPGDSLSVAQQKAQNAPSFQARQTYLQQLAGGQTVAYNKLTGQYETVQSAGQATAQNAAAATIKTLTEQRAQLQSAITTVDQNFPLLLQAAKAAGVNNDAPLINEIKRRILNPTSQSAALAQLNTLVPSVASEYSRIIARGGTVDDNTRKSAQAIVNGNYSLAQLNAVYQVLRREGSNVIKGYDTEISRQNQAFNGGSGGSGLYDF